MESLFLWFITLLIALIIIVPYYMKFRKTQKEMAARKLEAEKLGINKPRAQYPFIDVSKCIGCGSCVTACPEGDVLGVVYGKAVLINGLRCVGHGHCEKACPVGALKVGLGDITTRDDIPILDEHYQSSVPGLYVVGELGGLSLIRNAIQQGRDAVEHIATTLEPNVHETIKDVIIVGAGPAGLSAALAAVKHNMSYMVLDQQDPGGTILQYPRRKLVMTQPVEIPLYGKLTETEYTKEELLEIWNDIIKKFNLEITTGHKLEHVEKANGIFRVITNQGDYYSRRVVLALGRRGTPRKLNVPGENLPKVSYQLIDAQGYNNDHVLVVGGGDSAVEAAIGLARQKGNVVTISYRKSKFFRIKKKNEDRINQLIKKGKINPIFNSQVVEIKVHSVRLKTDTEIIEIPNDYVFVLIGGIPPFDMLKKMGIRFGGEMKPLVEPEVVHS
ncbi:MAG: 4Fe-4S dicluster domain-containing protein [Calditrichaeota bacterium]|nr:MAG: 4Fe-4S dicluster domain-containing protein [Calditrichota bacterium]